MTLRRWGLLSGLGLLLPCAVQATTHHVIGRWETLSYIMPVNPVTLGLMHTRKVLVASGSEFDATKSTRRAAVWDPESGSIRVMNVPWDIFCSGMSFLPDGRAFITGGTLRYNPFSGIRTTVTFDPIAERFIQLHDMAHGRWYPTTTVLPDGRMITLSGRGESGPINNTIEIYRIAMGWSPEHVMPWGPPLFPWAHVSATGHVLGLTA